MNNQYITSGISTGYLFFIQMLMLVFRQDLGVFLEHLGVFAGCFCRCRRQTAAHQLERMDKPSRRAGGIICVLSAYPPLDVVTPSHSKIALADANRRFSERILPICPLQAFNVVRNKHENSQTNPRRAATICAGSIDGHSFASREAGKRRFRDTTAQHGAKRTCKFRNRTGLSQGAVLRKWLDTVVKPAFEGLILTIDEATAEICAALHIPDHAPENDSWIAATAKQHRLILVTNTQHQRYE